MKKLSNQNYIDILDYLNQLDKEFEFDEINLKIEIEKKHFQKIKKENTLKIFLTKYSLICKIQKKKFMKTFNLILKVF